MDEIESIKKRLAEALAVIPDKHLVLVMQRDIDRLIELARQK